jgi:hypothetical protein
LAGALRRAAPTAVVVMAAIFIKSRRVTMFCVRMIRPPINSKPIDYFDKRRTDYFAYSGTREVAQVYLVRQAVTTALARKKIREPAEQIP